jgi:hypothetical protein
MLFSFWNWHFESFRAKSSQLMSFIEVAIFLFWKCNCSIKLTEQNVSAEYQKEDFETKAVFNLSTHICTNVVTYAHEPEYFAHSAAVLLGIFHPVKIGTTHVHGLIV